MLRKNEGAMRRISLRSGRERAETWAPGAYDDAVFDDQMSSEFPGMSQPRPTSAPAPNSRNSTRRRRHCPDESPDWGDWGPNGRKDLGDSGGTSRAIQEKKLVNRRRNRLPPRNPHLRRRESRERPHRPNPPISTRKPALSKREMSQPPNHRRPPSLLANLVAGYGRGRDYRDD